MTSTSVKDRVRGVWWGIVTKRRQRQMMRQLTTWASHRDSARIVQIGANDGAGNDPLTGLIDANPGWQVIFVEPMDTPFAALTEHRGHDPRFRLVQAAITDHDGEVDMITVDPTEAMPGWVRGISSINAETVMSHSDDLAGLADATRTVTVPAKTLRSLLDHCAVDHVDLLFLDTEGHDAVILDQLDSLAAWPDAVLYEHKHLTPESRTACERRFRDAGYEVHTFTSDVFAARGT